MAGKERARATTKLTIRLPTRNVEYVKQFARAHGLTVTEVIDRFLRRMQALDEYPVSADLDALTGLVPADVDARADYRRHLLEKHSR